MAAALESDTDSFAWYRQLASHHPYPCSNFWNRLFGRLYRRCSLLSSPRTHTVSLFRVVIACNLIYTSAPVGRPWVLLEAKPKYGLWICPYLRRSTRRAINEHRCSMNIFTLPWLQSMKRLKLFLYQNILDIVFRRNFALYLQTA